jgi:hypothetical protein
LKVSEAYLKFKMEERRRKGKKEKRNTNFEKLPVLKL